MSLSYASALLALVGYASSMTADPSPVAVPESPGESAVPPAAALETDQTTPPSLEPPLTPPAEQPAETSVQPPLAPSRAEELRQEAQQAWSVGDMAGYRAKLEAAVSAGPTWDLPRLELAAFLARDGVEMVYALGLLEEAERFRPDNPRICRIRGQLLELLKDDAGAVEAYGRSLALRDDTDLRMQRALILVRAGRDPEAIGELERIRAARPRDSAPRGHLADLYEKAGRIGDAEAELLQISNLSPNKPAPLVRLSRFYLRHGDPERARHLELRARGIEGTFRLLRPLLPSSR